MRLTFCRGKCSMRRGCRGVSRNMYPLHQECYARWRRWQVDPFLWRMPPNTSSDGLYRIPSPSLEQRRQEVYDYVRASVRRVPQRREAAEAAIRHAPGRWLVPSTESIVRGVSIRKESLLDVRQRGRTSMLRGKCGVTSPRVVNSKELSCTQKRRWRRGRGIKPILRCYRRRFSLQLRCNRYQGRENRQCFD